MGREEERTKILDMLQQGQITVEEASRLLEALEVSYRAEARPAAEPEPEAASRPVPPGTDWRQFGRNLAEQIKAEVSRAMGSVNAEQIKDEIRRAVGGVGGAFGGIAPGGRSNFSTVTITRAYLEEMPDDSHFTNYGVLAISEDVPEDLLKAKISRVTNFGTVQGPAELLRILQDRCRTNFGSFATGTGDMPPAAPGPPPAPAAPPQPMHEVDITGWELGGWQNWEYQGQYSELAIQCHGGNLVVGGTDEERLGLTVRKPIQQGESLPEGWPGGIRFAPRQEDSRLVFEIGDPKDLRQTGGLTFRFGVPETLNVTAETAAGNITARNLPGKAELRTGGGNIEAADIAGDAVVNSGGGELTLTDVAGSVRADTAGGNVTVRDVAGEVHAQTAGGEIHMHDIAGNVAMTSGGGNLEVRDVAGSVTANTGGGEIRVHDIAGNVEAETGGGDVSASDVTGNVTVGTGGGNVTASDVSGNVDGHTGAGTVSMHDISGSVTARTGAGDVSVSDIDGDATIETGFGQVTIRDVSGKVVQRGG